jgi:hypothetical protein
MIDTSLLASDLLSYLVRLEAQNAEILAALKGKPNRKYLLAEETAERLDRSPWTIRQLCSRRQVRAIKGEDGCWRIPVDEVIRMEEQGVPKLAKR